MLSGIFQHEEKTPEKILLAIQIERCERSLSDSGLTGDPSLVSKSQKYERSLKMRKKLEDPEMLLKHGKFRKANTPSESLMAEAIRIAGIPENTVFRAKYREYLKKINRCDREISRTKEIKTTFYDNGKIITSTTEMQKLRKTASKGFKS